MSDLLSFAAAVVGLLAVPGPTNTLLATAGATEGAGRAYRLLPGEIGGYLISIGVLTQVLAPVVSGLALASPILKGFAAVYLAWLAIRLWRDPATATDADGSRTIRLRDVFVTTLLNPKGLIFSFVIFPAGTIVDLIPYLTLFSALVVACGGAWVLLGGVIRSSSHAFATGRTVARTGAMVLSVFAATFVVSALTSIA